MFVYNNCSNDARVLKEAGTLVNAGYHVQIFALKDSLTPFYEIRNGIEIIRVPKDPIHYRIFRGQIKRLFKTNLKSISQLRNEYKNRGDQEQKKVNPTKVVAAKRKPNFRIWKPLKNMLLIIHKPLCFYDFYRKTKNYWNTESADIYHAHDLNTLKTGAKAARLHSSKLVYDSHELYTHRNKPIKSSRFYRYLTEQHEQRLIKKADRVITVSESIADYLKDKYHISRPDVIMNAPSQVMEYEKGKSLRKEIGIPDNLKIAIYSGGITFNRGLEKLIESLTLLPEVFLVMMGYGTPEYLEKLQKIANDKNVNDRFSFYGPVQPNEVTSYTSSADVGVAPIQNVCLSYYFCAPNKIFEYINGGIPVVASNFPDLSKIVTENEIGFVFDPEDINSIAGSINKIFADNAHYNVMKSNTLVAAKKYNWEIEEQKLLKLYNSISK